LNAMAYVTCQNFGNFADSMLPYILTAIEQDDDEACSRLGCGLISDLAHNIEKKVITKLP
jgi:hypothetical protein